VVISQPDDDGLDWDYGWVGKAQFVVVQQNKAVGNCGIEADNNKSNNDAEPRSAPEIWNLSLIGSDAEPGMAGKTQIAMHLRRGSAGKIKNAIITHFSDFPVDVEGGSSRTQAESGALEISTSVFFDNGNRNDWPAEAMDNDSGFDEGAHFAKAELQNRFMDPRLADMLNLAAPKFQPMSGSPVMTMGATPPADGFFEVSATFAGAVGTEDWTAGWTAYPAN
jgi:hypothetical protein